MTIETIKPALYVACRDCHKDCLAGDLTDLRCLDCRVHHECADVRAEVTAFFKKQQRYAVSGGIANDDQLSRLRRRLATRIGLIVADRRKVVDLVESEFRAALRETPQKRFAVHREEAAQLHPDVGRLQVIRR